MWRIGRCDTSQHTDFNETWPKWRIQQATLKDCVNFQDFFFKLFRPNESGIHRESDESTMSPVNRASLANKRPNSSTMDLTILKRGFLILVSPYSWCFPFLMELIISWWSLRARKSPNLRKVVLWVPRNDIYMCIANKPIWKPFSKFFIWPSKTISSKLKQ